MEIRPANSADLPALLEIYNQAVLTSTATFDTRPLTLEERRAWLENHNRDHHPLLVCELDGAVAGYASLSNYLPKPAYDTTAELSVYVHSACRRRGVATALMAALLDMAREDSGLHLIVSLITAGNEASCVLHRRFGFIRMGELPACGWKFGEWQSVETWYLQV